MNKLKFSLLIAILATNLFADEIDDIISNINKKREISLPKDKLVNIDSPMPKLIVAESNSSSSDTNLTIYKEKEIILKLKGIMNNSANINGKWVKVGQKIEGYTLNDIMDDSVYLTDGNKSKMLFFEQKSSKIDILIR